MRTSQNCTGIRVDDISACIKVVKIIYSDRIAIFIGDEYLVILPIYANAAGTV